MTGDRPGSDEAVSTKRAGTWRRLSTILWVLAWREVGALVGSLVWRRRRGAGRLRRMLRSRIPGPAQQLRLALEQLGTTFVKLGQILATRADLLPAEYQIELGRLQDDDRPESVDAIRGVIASELGHPVENLYASFDPTPLAAASIGQAHAAVTLDGVDVVVKVRRPGVVAQVDADLVLLTRIAHLAVTLSRVGRRNDVEGLAREFADTLRAELDYVREAGNAERFAAAFADSPDVHIPRIIWPLTTHQVLTMERVRGMKVTDAAGLDEAHIDRSELALRAAAIEMKMIFEDGFFHADPHPGNFFVEDGGRIALIDFGMTGTVDARTRLGLVQVIGALVTGDGDALVDALEGIGITGSAGARDRLRVDLMRMAARYLDQPLGDLSIGSLLGDLLVTVHRHRLRLPVNLALLVKTIGMCEGVAAQVDPSFRITTVLVPYVERLLLAGPDPGDGSS